jgi:glycosidase
MLWDDIRYEAERHMPHGEPGSSTARAPDAELLAFVRKLIALRKASPALRRGTFRWVKTGQDRLIAFWRRRGEERLLMVFNAGDEAASYRLRGAFRDGWDRRRRYRGTIEIPPRGWKILQALR